MYNSLEVTQLTWPDIFNDPMALFKHCLCMAQLLISLGSVFNSTADDICVHEQAETGVACIPACFTNATCFNGGCPQMGSGNVDVCGLYAKNQTSEVANLFVISVCLDYRGISQHGIDIIFCSSVLCKIISMSSYT